MTAAEQLAQEVGLSFTVAEWLIKRGFSAGPALESWLDPKLKHLTPPTAMADLPAATARIGRALRSGETIAIFGDYDCDGITSAAILTEVLQALGGKVHTLLASRFEGGYGFSEVALEKVRATNATLLITCDCGSSDHPRLRAAQQAGIDAVVIDHHLVPDEPLPAVAFLNPHRPDCGFPYKGLASCGLALFVAAALRKEMQQQLDVRRWLDLVAVGTIADVAPLDGDNRALVRAGLKVASRGHRVGLSALAVNGARGRKLPVGVEEVAYQIAPRLNAPGRLLGPRPALDLLLETDSVRAWERAEEIEQLSLKRRQIQRTIIDEATTQIEQQGWRDDPCLLLAHEDWHFGVVGIVAGRLAQSYDKPAIVIALEGDTGRGSARAPTGFQLYDSLAACREQLVGFGGHQAAAGLHLRVDQVDALRDAWRQACSKQLAESPLPPAHRGADVRLDPRDDLVQVLHDLERLEPTGEANPAPRILLPGVEVLSTREIKGHLKLDLRLGKRQLSGFGPEMGDLAATLAGTRIDAIGHLKRDHWRGGDVPEVLLLGHTST